MRTISRIIGGSLLALLSVSAFATDHRVTVGGSALVFTPKTLTINAGDTITFVNAGGDHNVTANDGSFRSGDPTTDAFSFTHTFATPGTFGYYCEIHGSPSGAGMAGSVTVNAVTAPPPGQPINAGLSGSWFDQAQSGHGFLIQVVPGNVILAYWFVFTPDGTSQSWLLGAGSYDPTSSTVTIEAFQDTGAKFPPNFNPADVKQTDWGSLTFTFTDCSNGTVSWASKIPAYGSGSLPITKIAGVGSLTCN
jgi:plastocyanin